MIRLFTLMLCVFELLSIGTAPVAHAVERVVCVEASQTVQSVDSDHATGTPDTDQGDKNVAHQHGGCHGHHFASLTDMSVATEHASRAGLRARGPTSALAPAALDPALRPPQA